MFVCRWWCETPRQETLVTRNGAKMWISFAIVGPKENLDKAKYSDCTITWKIRSGDGGAGAAVACNVRCLPKPDFTEDQISPSFSTEFKGVLEAASLAAKGQAPPVPDAQAPPGEEPAAAAAAAAAEAPAAAPESDAAPAAEAAPAAQELPAADAPAE